LGFHAGSQAGGPVLDSSCGISVQERVEEERGVCILESYALASLDFFLGFDCVFWREQIERSAIVSFAILVPQSPSRAVGHSLDGRHVFEVGEVLSAHFGQLKEPKYRIMIQEKKM